jgi:hypothetical protein
MRDLEFRGRVPQKAMNILDGQTVVDAAPFVVVTKNSNSFIIGRRTE